MTDIRPGQTSKSRNSWKSVRSLLQRIRSNSIRRRRGLAQVVIEAGKSSSTTSEDSATSLSQEIPAQTQKALVVAEKGKYEIRHDFPMPAVGDDEIMIRSHFVGLNPIDWKSVDYNFCLPQFPHVTGREMSGVVTQVGRSVEKFNEGERVWTSTYYKDVRAGCFQEYVVVPSHTVLPIPSTVPFEAAACLGVAALTAGMTLWKWLGVPTPSSTIEVSKTEWLLIWGGSTVTGQFATQLAVHSGLNVITVTSAETKALSEKLGASYVVVRDGKSDDQLIKEVRDNTSGRITRAIDLVGTKTAAICLRSVSTEVIVAFAPLAMMSGSQEVPENVVVHTVEMKQFVLDKTNVCYTEELGNLLESGSVILPDLHIIEGGLDAVQEGLEMLKRGSLKGKKLVVRM
ncbi:chaperonin 10-like protein [Truncatella angustata]|uniref:Chaperonin 10-like protein n=1 Tax=Truncatella angustata TaxID=152316 RepID=A0A9P8UFZ3_9PEZI|nr:chaperonin 10-like protein [Truncatella angustata]KAH6649189.1 chaperonin 10-like protein [Truncatella angustata]